VAGRPCRFHCPPRKASGLISGLALVLLALPANYLGSLRPEAGEGKNITLSMPLGQRSFAPARVVRWDEGGVVFSREKMGDIGVLAVLPGLDCRTFTSACQWLEQGRYLAAAEFFRSQIGAGAAGPKLRCGLGGSLLLQGELMAAARVYSWALADFPDDPNVRAGLGIIYAELDQPLQATVEFAPLLNQPRYATLARVNLGNALRRAGRASEALAQYERAASGDGRSLAAQFNRGVVLLEMERFGEAAEAFRRSTEHAGAFADSWMMEGLSRLRAREPVLAAVAFARARELGAESAVVDLGLGLSLQQVGLDREAGRVFERLLESMPENHQIYHLLAVSQVRQGMLAEAAQTLERGFAFGPQDADGHFLVGLKLLMCRQPERAIRYLLKAVSMGRRSADGYFALGQSYLQAQEAAAAERTLRLALEKSPDSAEIHFALGVALHMQKRLEESISEVRQASRLDPGDGDNRVMLIGLLREAGDFAGCAREGMQLVGDFPDLISVRFDTALCQALAGQLDRAAESLEDAMDQDLDGQALRGMMRKLAEMGEGPAPGVHLLRAIIQERRGNWQDAVRDYRKLMWSVPEGVWSQRARERIHQLTPADRD